MNVPNIVAKMRPFIEANRPDLLVPYDSVATSIEFGAPETHISHLFRIMELFTDEGIPTPLDPNAPEWVKDMGQILVDESVMT